MAPRQPPSVLAFEDVEHTARNDRLTTGAAFSPAYEPLLGRSGALIGPPGGMGEVTLPDQGTLRVAPGIFVLQGFVDAAQGQYVVINDGPYDKDVEVTQHASQFRRIAVVVGVLDSVMAGLDPQPVLDEQGAPVVDGNGDPVLEFTTETNIWDVYLVAGALSPTAPGLPPNITSEQFQAYAVLGWINVPPAGQNLTYSPNPLARVGSRTGILPVLASDDSEGAYVGQYRHHPTQGLQWWTGTAWGSIYTTELSANRVRINSGSDASAASTSHGLQIGSTAGANIIIDTNEVMARKAGAVQALYLGRPVLGGESAWDLTKSTTPGEALVTKDYVTGALARTTATTLRLTSTADANADSTGHALQIGATDDLNVIIDNNEIMARDDGALAPLGLTNPIANAGWNLASSGTTGAALVTKAYVASALADTGWVSFTPSSGWALVNGDGGARYRVKAGIFYMRFAATRASWGNGANLVTLSEAFRPAIDQTAIGFWGNAAVNAWEVAVHTDGVVELAFAGGGGLYLSASWPID